MDLRQAINEIVLNQYPGYKESIRVVNNTIRLNMLFKSDVDAAKFIDQLRLCIRQRLDCTFIVFFNYLEGSVCVPDRIKFDAANFSRENENIPEGRARSCDDRPPRKIILL